MRAREEARVGEDVTTITAGRRPTAGWRSALKQGHASPFAIRAAPFLSRTFHYVRGRASVHRLQSIQRCTPSRYARHAHRHRVSSRAHRLLGLAFFPHQRSTWRLILERGCPKGTTSVQGDLSDRSEPEKEAGVAHACRFREAIHSCGGI